MTRILVAGRASLLAIGLATLAPFGTAGANEYAAQIERFLDAKVRPWLQSPAVIAAIREQNAAHAGLDQAAIDQLDKDWRAEAKDGHGPLIDAVLARPVSKELAKHKAEMDGLVTEMFLMDDRGLNVGQSDVTSDYWQGDEAKWQKSYLVGPDAVFVDDIEFDDSTEMFQTQVSVSVNDPDSGKPIGAITVGLNVEALDE